MADILSTAVVAAIAEDAPRALIESHEALRRHAEMGWQLAAALAARLDDPFIARLSYVQTSRKPVPNDDVTRSDCYVPSVDIELTDSIDISMHESEAA